MNLVVVASSRALAERYTEVVDEITRSLPARAILVSLEPKSAGDRLDGDATAVCWVAEEKDICSERIRLWATGAVCARVPSAVDALCVPELPTVLVWLGPAEVEDPLFVSLADHVQRIVLDTEHTSLASVLATAHWARTEPGRPHVADLGWTRLAVWQEMCARFFDDARLREHAFHISRLSITQASAPGARLGAQALLLLGWFGSRLGWEPVSAGAGVLQFKKPDGGSLSVALHSVPPPDGAGANELVSVTLDAEHVDCPLSGELHREFGGDEKDVLVWRLKTGVPCATEQRVRLRGDKGGRLLERTLHRPPHDPALEEALALAERIFALSPRA
jgi:glucose-6-phosphate dehydrogenase assembly protein OpcA